MIIKFILRKILPKRIFDNLNKNYLLIKGYENGFPYRQYTKRYKCIFVHIPKTAGTSILYCFTEKRINRDHASYFDYVKADSSRFKQYFRFSFVRNPYDRAVSFYEYLKRGGNQMDDLYFQKLIEKKYNTFEKFILEYLDINKIHEHVLFRPQYLFIYNHKNESQVDFIGKYENLGTDFKLICNKMGVSFQLPLTNKTQRQSYTYYYSNHLVDKKICSLYKKDFELLNYSTVIDAISIT